MKVRIYPDTTTATRSGTNERGPWSMTTQTAYLFFDERNQLVFQLSLPKGQGAYPPGDYELSAASIVRDKYGELSLGRIAIVAPPSVRAAADASVRASAAR